MPDKKAENKVGFEERLKSSSLSDYLALQQVRNALWRHGVSNGAAVMVGSGFSRLADRVSEMTPIAPLWKELEEAMLSEMYQDNKNKATSNVLALADEYRAALGYPALDNLLRHHIRNDEWKPGEIHKKILRLSIPVENSPEVPVENSPLSYKRIDALLAPCG